jgi:hypothetical protein
VRCVEINLSYSVIPKGKDPSGNPVLA